MNILLTVITPLEHEVASGPYAPQVVPATGMASLAWLLVLVPLLSAGFLLIMGRRTDKWGHWLGLVVAICTAGLGLGITGQVLMMPAQSRVMELALYKWVGVGDLAIDFGMRVDPLSLTFVCLITFVGMLIHVYSVAYMEHDTDRRRFFAYLNFFIAAMLLLVIGNSYMVLFFGWEGVGLASYLLIGFWNFNPDYAKAAKKAFVMNRVGDAGMLIAMMAMFTVFGTVTFTKMEAGASSLSAGWATFIGLFLLVAACGKSAQFPLQAWLGDAMAGPTPVSALIHAATMVTAGVYLMVRSAPIYAMSAIAALVVTIIGAITLTFGAIVGCAKDDMKKVLAGSTMSQIGYMMLAAGLGPIGAAFGIFHLLTHGFFKAGLFLGAGSVMHGMNDDVNIRHFGGLSKYMKITWLTFGAGYLAIMGIPGFSGFFTKDKIIEAAFSAPGWQGWTFGLITMLVAGLTAFYMSRLFFAIFHGKARWEDLNKQLENTDGKSYHPHESSAFMTIPMIILALGSVGIGGVLTFLGFPAWLSPSIGHMQHGEPVLPELVISGLTLAIVLLGALVGYLNYAKKAMPVIAPHGNIITRAARKDIYQDEINETIIVLPTSTVASTLTVVDDKVVDGAVMGLAHGTSWVGKMISYVQNGYVRTYAAVMLIGVVVVVFIALMGI